MKKTPDSGGGPDGTADPPVEKSKNSTEAQPEAKATDTADSDEVTEADALRAVQGESTDRQDAARTVHILADKLRKFGDADINVDTFNFYAPSRDVNIGLGSMTIGSDDGTIPVSSSHLADYTRDYVEPPTFGDCLRILGDRHLLVLSGSGGSGRDATALALLDRVLTAPEDGTDLPIYSLSVSALADHLWQVPATGAGYVAVVDRITATSFEEFDDAWLTRLSSALRRAGSFLVLITGPLRGKLTEATHRGKFVAEHFTAPDSMEVLRTRVLAGGLDLEAAEVERRLDKAGAPAVLAERPWPRFAVTVSITVIEAIRQGKDLAAELEQIRNPAEQIREWFAHHDEPEHIALAMATAVLEGSSYLTVSDAAVELYTALALHRALAPLLRLRLRRSMATDQPWMVISPPEQGATDPPSVRFRSPQLQHAILTYAWTELDGLRPTLLSWLRGLVAHADVEVRARAAFAAGQLAADDFQHAVHHYLLPWAVDDSPMLRRGAALALSVVATVPRHTNRVWAILQEFADSAQTGRSRHAPATAAIAAAGPLGTQEPERALRLLRAIARDGGWELLEPLLIAVLQLLESGRGSEVIQALMDWTEQGTDSPVTVRGLVAFVVAVREPVGTTPTDGDQENDTTRTGHPQLLVDAARYHHELPELWGRALANDKVRKLALSALRDWLRIVDEQSSFYSTVLDVLAGVADRSQRDMKRLEYYLSRWEDDEDDPSATAGRILSALLAAG